MPLRNAVVLACVLSVGLCGCPKHQDAVQNAPTNTSQSVTGAETKGLAASEETAQAAIDNQGCHVRSYDIAATIHPEDHTLSATAKVEFHGEAEVDAVSFDLRPNLKIARLVAPDGSEPEYSRTEEGRVTVPVKGLGRIFFLTVEYSGEINGPLGGANNQRVWDYIGEEGTYVRFEAGWYPQVWGDRATADLHLTVPEGWTPVTSGRLVGQDGNTWHWHVGHPAAGLSFTAAQYEIAETMAGETPVQAYTFPRHKRRAGEFLDVCRRILTYYNELYGDYPFGKFAVAEIPDLYGGGHGDQGFIMLQESAFEGEMDQEFVAHEMAHNWWGSLILCTETEFMAEGFATYSQALWREHNQGPRGLSQAMREQAESVLIHSLEPAEEKSCFESESGPLLYEKGAWILHMLRHQVGDKVFFDTVRDFAVAGAGKVVTCKDFQAAFEEAHRKPLDWFFQQWLYGTGVPWVTAELVDEPGNQVRVKLHQRRVIGEGNLESADLDQTWKTEPSDFQLLIDVQVKQRGTQTTKTFTMTLSDQDFIFVVPGEATGLTLDPDCWLLDHSKGLVGELDGDMRQLQEELERELGNLGV